MNRTDRQRLNSGGLAGRNFLEFFSEEEHRVLGSQSLTGLSMCSPRGAEAHSFPAVSRGRELKVADHNLPEENNTFTTSLPVKER